MLMPESSSEIIFSGVTRTCCPKRTSSPVPRGTRPSHPYTGWRLCVVEGAALPCEISEPFEAEISFRLPSLSENILLILHPGKPSLAVNPAKT
jgi:hypothetical protein